MKLEDSLVGLAWNHSYSCSCLGAHLGWRVPNSKVLYLKVGTVCWVWFLCLQQDNQGFFLWQQPSLSTAAQAPLPGLSGQSWVLNISHSICQASHKASLNSRSKRNNLQAWTGVAESHGKGEWVRAWEVFCNHLCTQVTTLITGSISHPSWAGTPSTLV